MAGKNTNSSYEFDEFQLDVAKRRLLRGGEFVAIKPKAFDLLAVLVENNGKLLTKDELFRLVWGDQVVEEANLTVSISAIRRALGEKAKEPRYITNVSGRGYYFNADLKSGNRNGHVETVISNGNGYHVSTEPDLHLSFDRSDNIPQKKAGRRNLLLAFAAVLIVVPLAAYFFFGRKGEVANTEFGALSVKKITTSGRVPTAVISPDGKWFSFTQMEPDGKQSLWVSQTDGGGQLQLRPPSDRALLVTAFAPDSSKVYYVQFDSHAGERSTLFRLPAMGGAPEKLLEDVSSRPALAPDGKEIAFIRRDHEKNTSWLMTAKIDGSGETQLAVVTGNLGRFTAAPAWSPDGRRIAYGAYITDKVPGLMGIFTCDANGERRAQATKQEWNGINSIGMDQKF
ncbi:MAG: winged helix-turn-helix domain-containing protein [Pyrinomonadaceae bacterium]